MKVSMARIVDIEEVLHLHSKYHIDTISEEDKKDGFITTAFTRDNLINLIKEEGLFLAKNEENRIIGYVMAASWSFWSIWPMFKFMMHDLKSMIYLNQTLNTRNSYQYGPICIDKIARGTDVLYKLFDFARQKMAKKYPILVTFINITNRRSYQAHRKKLGLEVIKEFQFNGNRYYTMVYDTSKNMGISP